MKIIIILFVFFSVSSCFAVNILNLREPIEIKEILYYRDGGTTGVILKDATGKEIAFCFSPQSVFFYGTTHGSFKNARKVEIESPLEQELLSKIQSAINLKHGTEKQKKLSEAETAMELSKEETKLWWLLRALNRYKIKRKVVIFKKGKSKIEYENKEKGYSFIYPTTWEETSNGVHYIGSQDYSMGIVEAVIQINVESSNGLSPEECYRKEFDKYKKKGYSFNKETLRYKIANEMGYRFWDIIPQEYGVYGNDKFKMGQVIFMKNNKVYSIFYFNQSLNKGTFKNSLDKILKSFQVIESSNKSINVETEHASF